MVDERNQSLLRRGSIVTHPCAVCGSPVKGRSDTRTCSVECKRALKREYDRNRYPDHRGKKIAAASAWHRANRARKQEYDAKRRNGDKRQAILEEKRVYGKTHTRKRSSHVSRRKRLKGKSFLVRPADLRKMYNRYRGCCGYCGDPVEWLNVEWDHVIPIARGGDH